MRHKYYTIEQAEQQIPLVKRNVKRLIQLKKGLEILESIEVSCKSCGTDHFQNSTLFNKKYHKVSYEFFKNLEKLENMGCIVKDLNLGLIDFLAYHNGREVLLCWKIGEDSINHWHETDSGFSGRKPIWMLTQDKKNFSRNINR